jgi:hypothetical protein
MAFAILVETERCLDGVELVRPTPAPPPASANAVVPTSGIVGGGLLGLFAGADMPATPPAFSPWTASFSAPSPFPMLGPRVIPKWAADWLREDAESPRVRYKSNEKERIVKYRRHLDFIENPLSQVFLNCQTDEQLVDFMGEFGIPDWSSRPKSETPLISVRRFKDALGSVLKSYQDGDVQKAVKLMQPDRSISDLRPVLTIQRGKTSPTMSLMCFSLASFMCLEVGAIIAGGATVKNCLNCGKIFVVGSATGRRTTAYYCSNRCRVAYQRRTAKPAPAPKRLARPKKRKARRAA